jgi:hypothetical protein
MTLVVQTYANDLPRIWNDGLQPYLVEVYALRARGMGRRSVEPSCRNGVSQCGPLADYCDLLTLDDAPPITPFELEAAKFHEYLDYR